MHIIPYIRKNIINNNKKNLKNLKRNKNNLMLNKLQDIFLYKFKSN